MGQRIDRDRSRARIERDIGTLGGPAYTLSESAICRYAYTGDYGATLEYFTAELERIGFTVWHDPVGTLIASNVPPGRGLRSAWARTATRTAMAASTTARSACARRSRCAGSPWRPATACRCV